MPAHDQRFPVPCGPSTDQGHELPRGWEPAWATPDGPVRVGKETKDSPRRIDGAVAAVMAVHRAAELAGAPRLDIYI